MGKNICKPLDSNCKFVILKTFKHFKLLIVCETCGCRGACVDSTVQSSLLPRLHDFGYCAQINKCSYPSYPQSLMPRPALGACANKGSLGLNFTWHCDKLHYLVEMDTLDMKV